jgi:hypothetical protein
MLGDSDFTRCGTIMVGPGICETQRKGNKAKNRQGH